MSSEFRQRFKVAKDTFGGELLLLAARSVIRRRGWASMRSPAAAGAWPLGTN